MKNFMIIISILLYSIVTDHQILSQNTAVFIKSESLYVFNLKDGKSTKTETDINIIRLCVVDTTLYIKGYKGERRTGVHGYYGLKTNVWKTSMPYLCRNNYVDFLKEIDTNAVAMLPFYDTVAYSMWEDTKVSYLYKFNINNKLDSINISKSISNLRKKYKHLSPVVIVRRISDVYKNKCMVNIWVFTQREDTTQLSHNEHSFLFLYDLKRKKEIMMFPVIFGDIKDIILF